MVSTILKRSMPSFSLREREIHYIFSSHLRADQMCRGSFLGIHQ